MYMLLLFHLLVLGILEVNGRSLFYLSVVQSEIRQRQKHHLQDPMAKFEEHCWLVEVIQVERFLDSGLSKLNK
jgi:hypothetical protein